MSFKFLNLFLAILGLCFCDRFFLVVASGSYSLVVVRGLLIAVASLVVEHGPWGTWTSVVWHVGSEVMIPGLWSTGSIVVAPGLSCSEACGIFQPGD